MSDSESVNLVARWRQGDQQAADDLFRRHAARLTALARSRLSDKLAGRIDPEDVVQSVYRSFFADTREGRYRLEHGGDLWRLLVTFTLHKVNDRVKHNKRSKRTVEREVSFGTEDSLMGIQAALAASPSPLEAATITDEVARLMQDLKPLYRRMLELRLQGWNIDEIAVETQSGERTVRRVFDQVKEQLRRRCDELAD